MILLNVTIMFNLVSYLLFRTFLHDLGMTRDVVAHATLARLPLHCLASSISSELALKL